MNPTMIQPGDDELVMFHFGEDLGPERMAAIAEALARDPRCAARYAELRRLLAASASALDASEPAPGFERRVWQQLAPRLQARRPAPTRTSWFDWLLPGLALAASLGMGIVIGRYWQPTPLAPAAAPLALSDDAGERVLAAHLSRHLGQTERLLRVAENGGAAGSGELASALIESNRLYAVAAERAGKPALAQFLHELEPVLRELANGEGDAALGGAGLAQEQIRSRDLLFRLRALESLQSAPVQTL